ncbi:MAG: ATP synthase F1 subunit delta [Clostridia bacterium]|nr:ATP synthase F1 subunit delta [Clostridia bacterium]
MAELAVAMTYGEALFQAASELGKRDLILEEANQVVEILKAEPELQAFINTPVVAPAEKKKVLANIFKDEICEELQNYLFVLVDKGRARYFADTIKVYKELLNAEEGVSYGKIVSVKPLAQERLERFEEETGKLIKTKVKLENETDPRLIGGVKIFIEGKIIDASIRTKLDNLAETIL